MVEVVQFGGTDDVANLVDRRPGWLARIGEAVGQVVGLLGGRWVPVGVAAGPGEPAKSLTTGLIALARLLLPHQPSMVSHATHSADSG